MRRLATLLGHPIRPRSVVGHGTVFRLDVPLGEEAQVTLEKPAVERIDLLEGKLVVVIDDELAIRQGMHELLTRWGCLCVAASGPAQAIALLDAADAPDLIIGDYHLADALTGTAVIGDLRRRYRAQIPALLITADTSPDPLRQMSTADCMLQHKPVRPAQLRAACNQLLASAPVPSTQGLGS